MSYKRLCDECNQEITNLEQAIHLEFWEQPNLVKRVFFDISKLVIRDFCNWHCLTAYARTKGKGGLICHCGQSLKGSPTIEDIGVSDPDFTGGKRTEDYVREMREED